MNTDNLPLRPHRDRSVTGQARVLIRNYGTDIRVECVPCGINTPSYWPGAREDARDHNHEHHPKDAA